MFLVVFYLSNVKYDDEIEGYENLFLILNNDDMLDYLFCFEYVMKKFECYCKYCEKLVCIDCIVEIYNGYGYFLEKLFIVYKECVDYFYY